MTLHLRDAIVTKTVAVQYKRRLNIQRQHLRDASAVDIDAVESSFQLECDYDAGIIASAITCSVDKRDRYVTSESRDLATKTDSSPPRRHRRHVAHCRLAISATRPHKYSPGDRPRFTL